MDEDPESFNKRENLEGIMEIGRYESNNTENQDDDMGASQMICFTTEEENALYFQ